MIVSPASTTCGHSKPKKCLLLLVIVSSVLVLVYLHFIFIPPELNVTRANFSSYTIKYASHNDVIKGPGPSQTAISSSELNTTNMKIDYYNSNSPEFKAALKKLGYEPAEIHAFKSPYVVTPHIYSDNGNNIIKPPGIRKVKTISVFNSPFWFTRKSKNVQFLMCPYSECSFDVLGKKSYEAELLLFFFNRLGPPPKRRPGQIWGFCSFESAQYYNYPKAHYHLWKDQINWAVNYRTDAGLSIKNRLAWRDSSLLLANEDYVKIAKKKSKTAAWWVSHCSTHSKREMYVKEMQKYIDIDIYGRCSSLQCSKKEIWKCEEMLTTTYKFYLSFENSLCRDYVSEKFWRMFMYRTHIVPVGRSGFDYNRYIPGNFIVDAANFKTAKDLALYLKALGDDIPRYAKHLQEKDKLVSTNSTVDWCDVCERLHTEPDIAKTRVKDIKAWSHNRQCRNGTGDIL